MVKTKCTSMNSSSLKRVAFCPSYVDEYWASYFALITNNKEPIDMVQSTSCTETDLSDFFHVLDRKD